MGKMIIVQVSLEQRRHLDRNPVKFQERQIEIERGRAGRIGNKEIGRKRKSKTNNFESKLKTSIEGLRL